MGMVEGRRSATTSAVGERLRRERHARQRSRQSVGDVLGVSESTVGRMERGEGDGIAVRRWAAAADALDLQLVVGLREGASSGSVRERVLTPALIERFAMGGGWTMTAADPQTVILDRPQRQERLVVYLCDLPIEILDAADADAGVRRMLVALPPPGWRRRSLIVVRAELQQRYRAMDWMADDLLAFGTTGTRMMAALRGPRVRMPEDDALVWCDEHAQRLIPFGLSLEPGRRSARRRKELRRVAEPRVR
jgi:transcriptional regulator with XRE-family HTH domain